jgi:hypothetical protein
MTGPSSKMLAGVLVVLVGAVLVVLVGAMAGPALGQTSTEAPAPATAGAGPLAPAIAQTQVPPTTPPAAAGEPKPEEKKKTLWDEFKLFSYIEISSTLNPNAGRGIPGSNTRPNDDTNQLRFYEVFANDFLPNMAEFSIKRDPNEEFPFGFGLVLTAGRDAQKNHSIGIFREESDAFPFDGTSPFDIQEAYISGRIPLGNGIILSVGKKVTFLGYEVIESPLNLNATRGLLFTFAIPLTQTGAWAQYAFTDWFNATLGVVFGWDTSRNLTDKPSFTGQFAFGPFADFTTALNWIAGVEPDFVGAKNDTRFVIDLTANYTGIKNLTLGGNVDYGWEQDLPVRDKDANWWGVALYAAYDWTDKLRTALRGEFFQDERGVRTGFGQRLNVWEITATVQDNIWRGLFGRFEYRHDQADKRAFEFDSRDGTFGSKAQNTFTLSLFYRFF